MAAFIFDLDGTLVDNVYEHVLAWKTALEEERVFAPTWRIHRHIGMSGALLVRELAAEAGQTLSAEGVERIHQRHGAIFASSAAKARPLPGAVELMARLSQQHLRWSIATSGRKANAAAALEALSVAGDATIITGDEVKAAKPEPDLFIEAARRMQAPIESCFAVGDAVWDMIAARRAGCGGVGLLSGGYCASELRDAGASRVFNDPGDLLDHIGELIAEPEPPSGRS